MTNRRQKLRAVGLAAIMLLAAVTAVAPSALATGVSNTQISDPGDTAPVPGAEQPVLELTVQSNDMVVNTHDGTQDAAAGSPTGQFGANTRYADLDNDGAYSTGDEVFIDHDGDNAFTAQADALVDADGTGSTGSGTQDVTTAGTTLQGVETVSVAAGTSVSGSGALYFHDADSDGVYDAGEDIILEPDSTNTTSLTADLTTSTDDDGDGTAGDDMIVYVGGDGTQVQNGSALTKFDSADNLAFVDGEVNANSGYDDGEDIFVDYHNGGTLSTGADTFVNAGEDGSQNITDGAVSSDLDESTYGFVDVDGNGVPSTGDEVYAEGDGVAPGAADYGDDLNALTVVNDGTLANSDIDGVALYKGGSQVGTATLDNGVWVINPSTSFDVVSTTFTVKATISSDAPDGDTLNFSVPAVSDSGTAGAYDAGDTGVFFQQDAPLGSISNGADIVIDDISLTPDAASYVDPADGNTKIELAYKAQIDQTTTETSDFTVHLSDGSTVTPNAVADDDSDKRVVLDVGTQNSVRIESVEYNSGALKTANGASAPAANVSVATSSTTYLESAGTDQYAVENESIAIFADSDSNFDERVEIYEDADGDGTYENFVREAYTGDGSQVLVVDTTDLSADNEYKIVFAGPAGNGGETSSTVGETATFDIVNPNLSASVENTDLATGDDLNGSVSADLIDRPVDVTLTAPDGTEQTTTVQLDGSGEATFSFTSLNQTGDYTVTAVDVETGIEDGPETVTVSDKTESVAFGDQTLTENVGDIVEIPIDFQNSNTATVVIGSDNAGYNATVTVTDANEDGEAVIRLNTFTTGDGASAFSLGDDSDSLDSVTINTGVSSPLDTGTYDLEAFRGTSSGDTPADLGSISIGERATSAASVYTAPDGTPIENRSDIDVTTESADIAFGDVVVVEVEATGLSGAIQNQTGSDLTTRFFNFVNSDAASLTVEQTNPKPNTAAKTLDLSGSATVVESADNDAYYIVAESDNLPQVEAGDEYSVDFTVSNSTELASEDETVTTRFDVSEATVDVTEANATVADGEVAGETSLAPGTEVTVTVKNSDDNPFLKSQVVEVEQDGTFTAAFDFSDSSVGTDYTVTAEAGSVSAEASGQLVEAEEPTETTETETATETTETETVTETETTTEEETSTATATEESTTTSSESDTSPATTETGGQAGFGAVIALVAVLAAAMLAYRRD